MLFPVREAVQPEDAETSRQRFAGFFHDLFPLGPRQPEPSAFFALIAHDLDLFQEIRRFLDLVDQDGRFIGLKKQPGIFLCEFPREIVVHRHDGPVLLFRQFFEHGRFSDLSRADHKDRLEKAVGFPEFSFQFAMDVLHEILPK